MTTKIIMLIYKLIPELRKIPRGWKNMGVERGMVEGVVVEEK
jgi:hypothetical protein